MHSSRLIVPTMLLLRGKLIERARKSNKIKSTFPVRFDKAFLYFTEKHRGRDYAHAVKRLLPQKPTFHRVFKTILANKGWITIGQIGKASGCLPDGDSSKSGGRSPLEKVVRDLLRLGLIDEVGGNKGLYRIGKQFGSPTVKRAIYRKNIELEYHLLHVFRDWVRNCFLLAYDSHTIRQDDFSATAFNQTLWDMHGPIYFGPFSKSVPLKRMSIHKSFLIAEMIGFRKFTVNDTEATIERLTHLRQFGSRSTGEYRVYDPAATLWHYVTIGRASSVQQSHTGA